jgi:GT2 family glycosyltransferase
VLGVLVCHDGEEWLPEVLDALRGLTVRPQHLIAVDTGSSDRTAELLAGATDLLDGVLSLSRSTGFGAAVAAAVAHGEQRWGDPGRWVWLLHDDGAPGPTCLDALLSVAEVSPSAALLGPLGVDWSDPRMVIEAGLSTDSSGHLQTGIDAVELDLGQFGRYSEVLAVSSAGALVRRDVWSALGGYDPALPLLRDDLDFGWRVNQAGHVVLCVPAARLRHVAALGTGRRALDAVPGPRRIPCRTVDRLHGLRTYLVNCSAGAFAVGLPRLVALCLARALGFLLVRRIDGVRGELAALAYLVSGRGGLRAARRHRRASAVRKAGSVRGLLTGRLTRLRNASRAALAGLVRRRVQADAALGRLPSEVIRAPEPAAAPAIGPGGQRRLSRIVAVPVQTPAPSPPERTRPSPLPRGEPGSPATVTAGWSGRLVMVDVDLRRALREIVLAPPVLLVVAMIAVALGVHRDRLGLDLAGGRLLPLEGLGDTWASYLAGWHAVGGGTGAPAPTTLALVGLLGAPLGSPAAAVSLLLLAALPLAALSGYLATRSLPVPRAARALAAAAYALVPAATAGVVQGRLDVVVVHVLLPPVLAGVAAVLRWAAGARGGWLSTAAATALGLAVIGAFAPALHLLLLAVALVGFLSSSAPRSTTLRRAAGLFTLVLLPVGLLVPWPAVVVQRPAVLVHGMGAVVPEQWPGWTGVLSLDPGGPGAVSWIGAGLLLAAVVAAVLRPARAMLPGAVVVLLGLGAAVVLGRVSVMPLAGGSPRPGFTGGALLLATCGLLWIVLLACRPRDAVASQGALRRVVSHRLAPAAGIAGIAGLAVGVVLVGAGGPLAPAGSASGAVALVPALSAELERDGSSVLVVGEQGEPVRLTRARTARFGDDGVAPLPSTVLRLDRVAAALRSGERGEVGAAVAALAATGVEFIVLPPAAPGPAVLAAAQGLARSAPPTADGRPVLRVVRPSPGAELLGPQLAEQARSGSSPPVAAATTRVGVPAVPPSVAVRVAPGAAQRLLVLAANDEPGWRASVDGTPVPVVRAWGHQAAVEVPGEGAEVRVDRSDAGRIALLLGQAAVALLAVSAAVPSRRPTDPQE